MVHKGYIYTVLMHFYAFHLAFSTAFSTILPRV